MNNKVKVIIVVSSLLVAFAVGRFSTPEKIKVETKIVEVEKKTDNKDTDSNKHEHKKTTIVTTEKPNGEKQTTTTITDDLNLNKKINETKTDDTDKQSDISKETVRGDSKVTLSALAGYSLVTKKLEYGVSITKPILGPITVGVWVLSDPAAGASIGVTF